ncbi:MAG: lipid-A-disaccharide synthase [Flavobacteriales bacterium]
MSGGPLKLYVIAGEASGDLHGSNLIKAIKNLQPQAQIRGWGGDLMTDAGAEIVKHYRDLAFMGFIEVVMNIRTIAKNLAKVKEDILHYKPDGLILIDYPGFNLRIAEWAHEQGIKVFYYISPQVWAWKENRVKKIKRSVDHMYVVLPFEKDFFRKHQYEVNFVGHPLLDVISARENNLQQFLSDNKLPDKPIIALLPGSRKQEISTMLPIMLSVVKDYPDFQFVIGGAPGQTKDFYSPFLQGDTICLLFGSTYQLLQYAKAGLVTSGTATLEAGLFRMPQVVCYKGSSISYHIAKRLVKIKYISLVNLILDRPAVTELIQSDLNTSRIKEELDHLLFDEKHKSKMVADYHELHTKLGGPGASGRVASHLLKILGRL